MGFAQKYIPHYTYEDWLQWEGRWELIEGVPIAMSPMPLPEHQRLATEIRGRFWLALKKKGCDDCKAYDPIDFRIADDTILQPDVLIVCGKIDKTYLDFPPVLVVEVLSKATEDGDRNVKYNYYEQQGIKYYLLADWKKQRIEIYELIKGKYHLQDFENAFEFRLKEDCTISPDFDNVWE